MYFSNRQPYKISDISTKTLRGTVKSDARILLTREVINLLRVTFFVSLCRNINILSLLILLQRKHFRYNDTKKVARKRDITSFVSRILASLFPLYRRGSCPDLSMH